MRRQNRRWTLQTWTAVALTLCLLAIPAAGEKREQQPTSTGLTHLSQAVAARLMLAREGALGERILEGTREPSGRPVPRATSGAGPVEDLFNRDDTGLPQNEESVTGCYSRPEIILQGTNDYRGLLFPELGEPITGWHFSNDGGETLANEGLLPPVTMLGEEIASGGDPIVAADDDCDLYAAGLNYAFGPNFPEDFFPNGVGVYKSDPETLATCPGGTDPSCWPVRRAAAVSPDPGHFFDKPWFDVGESGRAGEVVWVAFTDFVNDPESPLGFSSASIKAVRCDADLTECTEPILISGDDRDVQFADVTVGPDGRTYITWSEIQGELELAPQTFIHKLRVARPGSTEFGPTRVIFKEDLPIPFAQTAPPRPLHANDFRVATYLKHEVVMLQKKEGRGRPRVFAVWDACTARVLGDTICEEPAIKLTFSDNGGVSWSPVRILSVGGDNYFPTIGDDPTSGNLAVAWFTNRNDSVFHNAQDVELATVDETSGQVIRSQRLTDPSNESEADPFLGGLFIGDYIEVFANEGTAYVGYNANYRSIEFLGEGLPIPQQDNYLTKAGL
jgi:hypothetical protein